MVVVSGAGHFVHAEREDEFFRTVAAFIGRN
jgi:pimeloyl-ACP methyl ester carboxylesterase